MIEQSHKTLLDPEKKKVYQRIMREAKERATF
jgi:heptaprenylglyceryl phosphate synthase